MSLLSSLKNKNILLGISGGIAAYKSAFLVRELKKIGANVRVIMTESAKSFITPLTMQALSGEEVRDSLLDTNAEAGMGHIELARWAELIVIAPASANLISELAYGSATHLLTTVCLASSAPIVLCPAMNKHMWQKPVVQRNIATVMQLGFECIGPDSGEQACGDFGVGRMSEVSDILPRLADYFKADADLSLKGKRVLITLGPTREYLDPVRYISNESSGLMGFSLAMAAFKAGASVCVVAGPTQMAFPDLIDVISITSADEMYNAVMDHIDRTDIFIATAAVSDYRVPKKSQQKIKKSGDELVLQLIKNKDILSSVGTNNLCDFVVGFAAETNDIAENAKKKLVSKNADLIVANQVGIDGNGFNSRENQVTVYGAEGQKVEFDKMKKELLAKQLIELITTESRTKNS